MALLEVFDARDQLLVLPLPVGPGLLLLAERDVDEDGGHDGEAEEHREDDQLQGEHEPRVLPQEPHRERVARVPIVPVVLQRLVRRVP